MATATVFSRARQGIDAPLVRVEVYLATGIPGFSIVGLPETAIKESRDRVRSAIQNSGFRIPHKKIIVSLSPADLPKEGARFDLPIAIGILVAAAQLHIPNLKDFEFAGELGLGGELRPVTGILSFAIETRKAKRTLCCAATNAQEASVAEGPVWGMTSLNALIANWNGAEPPSIPICSTKPSFQYPDLKDIQGQHFSKRALLIAAAGGHSLLMSGPPGAGKTMLASRLPGLLPPLSHTESLEVAAIYSNSTQGFNPGHFGERPFRAPHHTASAVALVGGGSIPKPGEISLAHHGVLFLDELPEFPRKAIEVLRQPLETKKVHIARAQQSLIFPAKFQLIAAMNPCPCGYLSDPQKNCTCTSLQIQQYQAKLSGPLLDRIDLHIEVPRLPVQTLLYREKGDGLDTERLRMQVLQARARQSERQNCLNSELSTDTLQSYPITTEALKKLEETALRLQLSARACYRIWKVARTISDLEGDHTIQASHLLEAAQYREALKRKA